MSAPDPAAADTHYFDPSPVVASDPQRVQLALADLSLRLHTDRGVFSARSVDPGTKVLLQTGPRLADQGVFADLGCGYGPIALTLATRRPNAHVWAIDINARARELTGRNAAEAGLSNVTVIDPDGFPKGETIDELWSNPPIRIGKSALHGLLTTWLTRLSPTGRAVLVVQKHLGADSLARWLDDNGWSTERIASRQAYRVLEVRHA